MTAKVRDVLKLLREDGWYPLKGSGGDHHQFKHSAKPGKVTVAGEGNDDIPPKTLRSILRQAGLDMENLK